MKKYYLFAALATAGLFASCSSDEDFAEETAGARAAMAVNDNEAAEIKLGVDEINTRGTGLVGTTTGANTWAGQTFNVFMFNKGTFVPANDGSADILNNQVLTTETGSSIASYKIAGVKQFLYYPSTGSYDFFAYRIDDAGTGAAKAGVPDTDDSKTEVRVPFIIDGTQDLLIGVAKTDAAKADLATKASITEDAAAEKIYSAYAARRNVNPQLKFAHMLTRLKFQVIANSREVSDQATKQTTDGTEQVGFKVTSIKVYSKSEGNLIAAYKSTSPNAASYATPTNRIEWTKASEDWADPTTLKEFELMSREKTVDEKAAYGFVDRNPSATNWTVPATYNFGSGTPENVANAGTVYPIQGTDECYTAAEVDDVTGMPKAANKTTVTAAIAAGINPVYFPIYKDGNHGDPATTAWNVPTYTNSENLNANLVTLDPVVPKWTGYVAGTPATYGSSDATSTYANEAALDAAITSDPSIKKLKGDAAALTAAQTAENVGKYFVNTDDSKVYEIIEATPAVAEVPGDSVATDVGDHMFVAPADVNGYKITITYSYSKKLTGTSVTPAEGSATIVVKRTADNGGVAEPAAFSPGKGYNIRIKLYKNGEISFDTDNNAELDVFGDDEAQGISDVYDAE